MSKNRTITLELDPELKEVLTEKAAKSSPPMTLEEYLEELIDIAAQLATEDPGFLSKPRFSS